MMPCKAAIVLILELLVNARNPHVIMSVFKVWDLFEKVDCLDQVSGVLCLFLSK